MERLVPEIGAIRGARAFDWEQSIDTSSTSKHIQAGVDRADGGSHVTLIIQVGTKSSLPPACSGSTGIEGCIEIRNIPGEGIAYLKRYSIPGTSIQGAGVTFDRTDGVRIKVWNGTISTDGMQPPPLDLDRVLEVAQGVTIVPPSPDGSEG